MVSKKKRSLIGPARDLYARGETTNEIAHILGVHPGTVRNWANGDRNTDNDWDRLRDEHRKMRPELILRRLKLRFALALQGKTGEGENATDANLEDRMLKLIRIIEGYRNTVGDVSPRLAVMEEFAAFCAGNLGESDVHTVRNAVNRFLGHVKDQTSIN